MTPTATLNSINGLVVKTIEAGLCNQQNFAAKRDTGHLRCEISISGAPDLSISLKNTPYDEIYETLAAAGAYNLRMIDGALVQMGYTFERDAVCAHRLAFFPAPHFEPYEDNPESYENDDLYADIVGRNLVHFPIRFDFDSNPELHVEVVHPRSHLTLGQYKNCRIPVNAPVTPARFMKFILRNFYHTAFMHSPLAELDSREAFPDCITNAERGITYLVC